MSRRCQIVFVPEDEQHASLMRGYFVGGRKFDQRGVYATKHWTNKAGNYVKARDWFCEEIKLQIDAHWKFGVILVIDEDGMGAASRQKYVDEKLKAAGLPGVNPEEGRLLVVPVRNIETWMAWAARWQNAKPPQRVEPIDESVNYKADPPYRDEPKVDAYIVGKLMAEFEPANPPSSIPDAMRKILVPLNEFANWTRVP